MATGWDICGIWRCQCHHLLSDMQTATAECSHWRYQQWRIQGGGVGGGSNPPMTGRTKIFSIELEMVYSVLCVIYAVSLAQ